LLQATAADVFTPSETSHIIDCCGGLQTTSFGAVFDVLLDVALRGWLWVTALPPSLALWVPLLELAVFAFTHQVRPVQPKPN
jgi:hypothetical protein